MVWLVRGGGAGDVGVLRGEEMGEALGVSRAWRRRLLQRRRGRGSYAALDGRRGRKPAFSGGAIRRLERLIAEQPDATLEALRDRSGVSCSVMTVFNTLNRLGYRRKKRRSGRRSRIGRTLHSSAARGDQQRVA